MTKLCGCASLLLLLIVVSGFAFAQENPGGYTTLHPNQEFRIPQLPAIMARSHDPGDVLLTSLDIAFRDPDICCGKNSALDDRALAADPLSLKDIASKINGKWRLGDGRPVQITADFVPQGGTIDISRQIIGPLLDKHPLLLVWNSHLYVLYGAVYDELGDPIDGVEYMIHKLFLLDARYSDSRREVTFNRDTDDWGKVQGVLLLTVSVE
jgi:hypothetical protein